VCAYPKDLEESAADHGEFRPPSSWVHNNRRHYVRIVPPVPGLWLSYTHSPCICNEIVSARNRVLGKTPEPSDYGIRLLRNESKRMAREIGHVVPWTLEQVLDSFTGARRTKYQQAYDSLLENPVHASDGRIQSFVKAEKFDPGEKVNPDPRMIQARHPRYNLMVAKYLRPTEHAIYNLVGADGLRQVAKGMNQYQRAECILDKFSLFKQPVCFSIDCSRWDKHVRPRVLDIEHGFYRALVGEHPEFNRLLSWQRRNRCRTAGGVKYVVNGGRMSGDINTALGNCFLAVAMVRAAMRHLGIVHYSIYDDGDDVLVFVEESDFDAVSKELQKIFLWFGQELKIENVARRPSDVVFCQSRLCHNGERPLMVRNWRKVLSQACCGTKHWNDANFVAPMLGLVGACELALGAGVPILQEFACALQRMAGGKIARFVNTDSGLVARLKAEFGPGWEKAVIAGAPRPITTEARYAFAEAFQVPCWEQEAVEDILRSWKLDSFVASDSPVERDHTWEDRTALENILPQLF